MLYHCLLWGLFGKVHRVSARANGTDWLERAAVGASAMCLVHCLALPVLVALAPALSSALSIPEGIHRWLLAAAVPMASAALLQGRAVHGGSWPLAVGCAGLFVMAAGTLVWSETDAETPMTVGGSAMLAVAHVANWRKRHGCG